LLYLFTFIKHEAVILEMSYEQQCPQLAILRENVLLAVEVVRLGVYGFVEQILGRADAR
jgi:hypothetical protein